VTQVMPKRTLTSVSRNTYLVFLAAASTYKSWKQVHPSKDAKYDFPGFDLVELREAAAPYKDSRPLTPDEVAQHCVLLASRQLLSRRPSQETREGKDYHFTLTEKGEAVYDRLATAKYAGKAILPAFLEKKNAKLWTAFVVLAFMARSKPDSLTDAQIAMMTGLTESSAATGRRRAAKGFMAYGDDGKRQSWQTAVFVITRDGGDTKRCLHRDQWILDGEDLSDVIEALAASPVPEDPPEPEDKTEDEAEEATPEPEAQDPAPTAVAPVQAQKGARRIVVWLSPFEYKAVEDSLNGSGSVEEYVQEFVGQTVRRAFKRKAVQAKLDKIAEAEAKLAAEREALQADLQTL